MEEKRKIFISAHPADRYDWLDAIVATIEKTGSCTAVYNEAPSDNGPTLPEGVELMVVLASIKYFTWANSGYRSEFFAAVRDGVRVLPILIESGQNTIDLVNMRLGKLQFIDATESGEFALRSLYAHLTIEEREIDRSLPSVFISYRRADKPLLEELLKRINSFEGIENINVWYDEIITPGENYSAAIMRELVDCDLFLLLVTPRILENGNYVHRVEYKTAKEKNKRIIALEAEKTDRKTLEDMYPSLPRLASVRQSGAMFSVFRELIALKKKRGS